MKEKKRKEKNLDGQKLMKRKGKVLRECSHDFLHELGEDHLRV